MKKYLSLLSVMALGLGTTSGMVNMINQGSKNNNIQQSLLNQVGIHDKFTEIRGLSQINDINALGRDQNGDIYAGDSSGDVYESKNGKAFKVLKVPFFNGQVKAIINTGNAVEKNTYIVKTNTEENKSVIYSRNSGGLFVVFAEFSYAIYSMMYASYGESGSETLYIGTSDGVYVYDSISSDKPDFKKIAGTEGNILTIESDPLGIYAGSSNGVIYFKAIASDNFVEMQPNSGWDGPINKLVMVNKRIFGISENGKVWFISPDDGSCSLEFQVDAKLISLTGFVEKGTQYLYVGDDKGNLWRAEDSAPFKILVTFYDNIEDLIHSKSDHVYVSAGKKVYSSN